MNSVVNVIAVFFQTYPRAYVLALLSGALLPLAFAPYGVIPLAVVCPALLFYLWTHATAKQAIYLGYSFGLGFFGLGVSWVAVSMLRFGNVAMPVAALLTLLFALILSSYIALAGYLLRRYFTGIGVGRQLLVLMPALWVLAEWLRAWLFTGFPWLNLGYSQTDGPLAGLAPIVGVFGLSYLLALAAGVLVWALQLPRRQRWIVMAGGIGVTLLCWPLQAIEWGEAFGEPLKASLIQGNIAQDQKWLPQNRKASIDLYVRLTRANWDSDIIVWPETALPAYFHQSTEFLNELGQEAKSSGAHVLLGLAVLDQNGANHYYNSMVLVGEPFQFYHKRHLVPFGEFLPFKAWLGELIRFMDIPMADFSSGGAKQPLMQAGPYAIGMSICYEDAFGEEVIEGLPEAKLLVNVSNDAWFGDSFAPHQHLQMARMRSMETRRPMLRATNNGISAIIDHHGVVTKTSPQFTTHVLTGVVQPRSGSTPYVIWGNYPVVVLALLLLLLLKWKFGRIARPAPST